MFGDYFTSMPVDNFEKMPHKWEKVPGVTIVTPGWETYFFLGLGMRLS